MAARHHHYCRKLAVAAFVFFGVTVAGLWVVVEDFDWNQVRGWLSQRASEAAGRPVEIRGNLRLVWQQPSAHEAGPARWIPWPQLDAEDVAVGNPAWADASNMMRARQLRVTLRVLPLLERRLVFERIEIDGLSANLLRDKQGRNNWTFAPPPRQDGDAPWQIDIHRLLLRDGRVTLADAPHALDLEAQIASIVQPPYGVNFSVRGEYRGTPVIGTGRAGSLLALREGGQAYPLEVHLHSGKLSVAAVGKITDLRPPAQFDVKLDLAAPSMAEIYGLTHVTLPDTPPFTTSGRLYGRNWKGSGRYTFEDFSGRVGASDLSGTLVFAMHEPRPLLSGAVRSKLLRFADLGPSIGAKPGAPRTPGRVLPSERLRVERLDAMDAQVKFSADRLVHTADIPADDVHTTIRLDDGVLTLDALELGLAGGKVAGQITLDSRQTDLKARVRGTLKQLQMKKLMPGVPELYNSLGLINARVVLGGSGDSVARILAGADGEVQITMNRGSFSKLLLEEAGLNIGSVVLTNLFGDRQIQLNCLVGDFRLRHGVAVTRSFLLDTDDARVPMTGTISLADETLDLTLTPQQKALRVLSLRAPLYVKGTFKQPRVSVDKGVVAARVGGAVALGAVAPLAAVVPLVAVSPEADQADCVQLPERPPSDDEHVTRIR
jgi:uncharacterized protein involved in outer membrane biogenesis